MPSLAFVAIGLLRRVATSPFALLQGEWQVCGRAAAASEHECQVRGGLKIMPKCS